ncbi:MAG: hypothetical protein M3Q79_00830 [bacterium]|nr:hypothetical protein [bacterium]
MQQEPTPSLTSKASLYRSVKVGFTFKVVNGTLELTNGTIIFKNSSGQLLVSVPVSEITEVSTHPTRLGFKTIKANYDFIFADENKHTAVGALAGSPRNLVRIVTDKVISNIEKGINSVAWVEAIKLGSPGVPVKDGRIQDLIRFGVTMAILTASLMVFVTLIEYIL